MSRSPTEIAEQIKTRNIHVRCLNSATPMEVWADGTKRSTYWTEAAAEQRICELLGLTWKEKVAFMQSAHENIRVIEIQHAGAMTGSP